jgi:hypothetical protein
MLAGGLPLFEGVPPLNRHAIRTRRIGSTRGGAPNRSHRLREKFLLQRGEPYIDFK